MGKTKENQAMYYDEVIRLYFEEGLGSLRITHLVPVSRSTILRWIRNFVSENPEYRYQMQKASTPKLVDPAAIERQEKASLEEIKALKEELGRLRVKLQKAELRADLYDEMINVAEKQFNIPIRKKVGVKR
jgi:transposase